KEVVLKIAAKHDSAMGAGVLLKELSGLGLATPAGLSIFNAGRPKPSPVVRLFSTLVPKDSVPITIDLGEGPTAFEASSTDGEAPSPDAHTPPPGEETPDTEVPLVRLAWARSGDKGNKANVGVIARDDRFMPYIWAALSDETLAARFGHFIEGGDKQAKIHRFYLPGLPAMNVLIDDVLGGGGVASLRNDAQGKAFGQILLDMNIPVPTSLVKDLS
ncbi:MAG: terpene utilization protein AtuA, partial [Pseudomonadota bacterium]